MKEENLSFTVSGVFCRVQLPLQYESAPATRFSTVYLLGESDPLPIMEYAAPHMGTECEPFIIVSLEVEDWNRMLPPWPVPKLGKRLGPFEGGGPAFIHLIAREIKPYVDSMFRTSSDPAHTAIAGYSLAGLLVLYSLYNNCRFSRFACMSGSLWFPGWVAYAGGHRPAVEHACVYISLGDRERITKNPVMATVDDCTRKTVSYLSSQNDSDVFFEYNSGGHFTDVPMRIAKGLVHCMGGCKICP